MANNTLAYGFVQYAHVLSQRLTTIGETATFQAIQESAAEHSRMLAEILRVFVAQTTDHKKRFRLPGSGTLQPLDENGIPLPSRPSGYYDVAFPIQAGGDAWAQNYVARELMTIEEANRNTLDAQQRDADWMFRHILAATLYNATWAFTDSAYGSLTIQPLANSDTVKYVRKGGASSTDNHYLGQAIDIDDSNNPFPTIYDELMEHPSNSGPVVVFIPTNQKSAIKDLTNFIEVTDPDIKVGMGSDVITASTEAIRGPGDEVLGKVDGCWIVEWKRMPDDYLLGHAVGAGPWIRQREYPSAALQGFFSQTKESDPAISEVRMIRHAGFGVENRVAAVALYIGNATYQNSSTYTPPLAV